MPAPKGFPFDLSLRAVPIKSKLRQEANVANGDVLCLMASAPLKECHLRVSRKWPFRRVSLKHANAPRIDQSASMS